MKKSIILVAGLVFVCILSFGFRSVSSKIQFLMKPTQVTSCYYTSSYAAQTAMNAAVGNIVMGGGMVSSSGVVNTGTYGGGDSGGMGWCYTINYYGTPLP